MNTNLSPTSTAQEKARCEIRIGTNSITMMQKPIYIDVERKHIILVDEGKKITARDMMFEENEFEQFLDGVEKIKDTRYIVLLLRPGSAVFQRRLRQVIRDRSIDVGFEPLEAGKVFREEEISQGIFPSPQLSRPIPKGTVFFECRNNQLFSLSLDRLKKACDDKTKEIREQVDGNEREFLRKAATTTVELDGHRLDYTYALLGKYVLTAIPDAEGYPLEKNLKETDEMWFGSKLAEMDPGKQSICFFVRPDSFEIFKRARALAWIKNIKVSVELLDEKDPVHLNPGGSRIL